MKAPPQHPELGAALKELKEKRGVSQSRLARIAGVSRRHVSVALGGGNITILILKKLMRALRAESVPIGELTTVTGELAGVDAAVLVAVADQLDHGVETISAAATSLRMYSKPAAPPTTVNAKAAALVCDFAARVHQINDPAELAAFERALDEALRSDTAARSEAHTARRKSTR
ncbi:MAG TPA: helix-turn-helix transcriptional regulator [Thermoanaerobaculia bacterium]|nr:helix-turn-helix transcriptional regulator [Thermoanaerobaculia bacterium]